MLSAVSSAAGRVFGSYGGVPAADPAVIAALKCFRQHREEDNDLGRTRLRQALAVIVNQPHSEARLQAAAAMCDSGWTDAQRLTLLRHCAKLPAGHEQTFATAVQKVQHCEADETLKFIERLVNVASADYVSVAEACYEASKGQTRSAYINILFNGPTSVSVTWVAALVDDVARAPAHKRMALATMTRSISGERVYAGVRAKVFRTLLQNGVLNNPQVRTLVQGRTWSRPVEALVFALHAAEAGQAGIWKQHHLLSVLDQSENAHALAQQLFAIPTQEFAEFWARVEILKNTDSVANMSTERAIVVCGRHDADAFDATVSALEKCDRRDLLETVLDPLQLPPAAIAPFVDALTTLGHARWSQATMPCMRALAHLAQSDPKALKERVDLAQSLGLDGSPELGAALIAVCQVPKDRLPEFEHRAQIELPQIGGKKFHGQEVCRLASSLHGPWASLQGLLSGAWRLVFG